MRLTEFYLFSLLSFTILGIAIGQKLTCAKDGCNSCHQGAKHQAEKNKITPVGCSVNENKAGSSLILSVKPSDKIGKMISEKNENIETIREKLMKTLLENGEVKCVNSHGLTSEEVANKNHMESKHHEIWAVMDEIMKRKNFLRKEIEEFYKRLPKSRKIDEPEYSEQTDTNSGEDYSEENLFNEGKESESAEIPDERMHFKRPNKRGKNQRNFKGEVSSDLEMSQSQRSKKVSKAKFPKTEKYPYEAGTPLEDLSEEEANNKRNENELRNKNMQLSKLFVQQMKEIYEMENKSRKAQRSKRHYGNQIPSPNEASQEGESEEIQGKDQRKNFKKQKAIRKKFYIIDDDPLGFYYYFRRNQKGNHSPIKVYPAVEVTKSEYSKKKSSKIRSQQLKKKRISKKKKRYGKEGILIKQIEENHLYDPKQSIYFGNMLLPQSTQLQAKYLCKNGQEVLWNKNDRLIPKSEFADFDDIESSENLKLPENSNSKESQPEQMLINNLAFEDQFICTPLEEATTETNITPNYHTKNDTETIELCPVSANENSTIYEDSKIQSSSSQLTQMIEDLQSLEDVANPDETPKVRVPRSYRSRHYRPHVECRDDCCDLCSAECEGPKYEPKYEPEDESTNWDELNMYINLLKKLFEEDPVCPSTEPPQITTTTTTTTTTESTTTTDSSSEENLTDSAEMPEPSTEITEPSTEITESSNEITESSTVPATTPAVVSPGNYGINLDKIAEEISEALQNENSDTIIPSEESPVAPAIPGQPTEKNEQSLILQRVKGYWLPLKLVQNTDGRFNIQLDLKYICRRCTKQRQKRKRKQHKKDSNESH